MSIGDRIKEIRGETSRDDFAATFGVNRNTIQGYEIYGKNPKTDFILDVCEKFNIHTDWLLLGIGPKYRGEQQQSTGQEQSSSYFDYVPMVEAKLSAGGGAFVESEGVQGYYAFRKDWLRRVASSTKDLVLMRVIGDSMSPTIQERDTVMVDTGRRDISEGKVYAIRYDHTIMIKRLTFRPEDKIRVISDNKSEYEPYEVKTADLHIIGQVIFFSRVLIPE
jgi:phage repressor protein C with HTH and peptisase S24 domain